MGKLLEAKQPFYKVKVRRMHLSGDAQSTLSFGRFFCEEVSPGWFSESDLTRSSYLKSFFGPGMGLYFWHVDSFMFTPTGAFEQTKNLWDHLGIGFGS